MRKSPGRLVKNLAKNLRRLRGMQTQTAYAKKLGVSQATLNRLEQGCQNVTLTTLEHLCESAKLKISNLLEEESKN